MTERAKLYRGAMNFENHPEYSIVIRPRSGWSGLHLKELWDYKDLWFFLMRRDIQVRYRQTFLGVTWAVIQPVMAMAIFSIVFGRLANLSSDGHPYPLFVYSALLPWIFFSTALSAAANSVVGSANLVTKVYFPRTLIPLASIGASFMDFLVSLGVMMGLMIFYGQTLTASLLAIPFLCVGVALTALGIGIWLSAFMVSYRDFRHVIPFALQIGLYATPVVYSTALVPARWRWILYINPMAGWISGFRAAFLGEPFDVPALTVAFAVSFILILGAFCYFHQAESEFADII